MFQRQKHHHSSRWKAFEISTICVCFFNFLGTLDMCLFSNNLHNLWIVRELVVWCMGLARMWICQERRRSVGFFASINISNECASGPLVSWWLRGRAFNTRKRNSPFVNWLPGRFLCLLNWNQALRSGIAFLVAVITTTKSNCKFLPFVVDVFIFYYYRKNWNLKNLLSINI